MIQSAWARSVLACLLVVSTRAASPALGEAPLRLGRFNVDATPPLGSPLAYNRMTKEGGKLTCRGVILLPQGQKPIVLGAIDWIGIGNEGYTAFRKAIAEAAGTEPSRVALHALHQHDAPRCDFTAEAILAKNGMAGEMFDVKFTRALIDRVGKAVHDSIAKAVPITHVAHGQAAVDKVASNRRILGEDGRVKHTRWTATRDARLRALPTGIIDPMCKLVSFWNQDQPVAALTYYATHPQSYYRTGAPSPDFPGIARNLRDKALPEVLHVHFNGAGGNIGAGKWNDGSPKNRLVLAKRVEAGMAKAWQASLKKRRPIAASEIEWHVVPTALPVSKYLSAKQLESQIGNAKLGRSTRIRSAVHLAWLRRCEEGHKIDISCLALGDVRILHMPGELFVEYQLAAQKMRPDLFVAMAAYGDYAPGYIGTAIAYGQGGYETSPLSSRVSRNVETVLMDAISHLLKR